MLEEFVKKIVQLLRDQEDFEKLREIQKLAQLTFAKLRKYHEVLRTSVIFYELPRSSRKFRELQSRSWHFREVQINFREVQKISW